MNKNKIFMLLFGALAIILLILLITGQNSCLITRDDYCRVKYGRCVPIDIPLPATDFPTIRVLDK